MKKTAILLFVLLIMSCGCTNISGGVTSVPETTPAVAETEGTEEAVEAVIYIDEDAIESSEKAFQPEPEKPAEPASVNIVCAGDNLIHTPIYRIAKETAGGEGYEFSVSTPRVLLKTVDGVKCEPIERMVADVPENAVVAGCPARVLSFVSNY